MIPAQWPPLLSLKASPGPLQQRGLWNRQVLNKWVENPGAGPIGPEWGQAGTAALHSVQG